MNRKKILMIPQITLFVLSIAFPSPAFALMNQSGNSNTLNPSKLEVTDQGCNSICDQIVDGDNSLRGVTGSGGWNTEDDQWCANHGSQTEPAIGARPGGSTRVQGAGCPYPLFQSDVHGVSVESGITPEQSACRDVNQKLLRCIFRHSQVETQCMAYKQYRDSSGLEKWLIAFDSVAAGSCGAACVAKMLGNPVSPVVDRACKIAGKVAGASEVAAALFLDQGPVGRAMGGVMGGLGMAGSWGMNTEMNQCDPVKYALLKALQDAWGGVIPSAHADSESSPGLPSTPIPPKPDWLPKDRVLKNIVKEGEKYLPPKGTAQPEKRKLLNEKQQICGAAVLFATLAGLRASAVIGARDGAKDACRKVEDLTSRATILSSAGGPGGGGYGGPVSRSGNGSADTGASAARTRTNVDGSVDNLPVEDGRPALPPEYRAALDGQMLTNSGLDRFASEKLDSSAVEEMAKSFESGAGLSSTLGSMGGSLGSLGGALTGLAQTAYQNAASVKLPGVTGTAYASLGGGAKSPASASDAGGMPDFGNLFGGKGDAAAAGGSGSLSFNQRPESTDIWHADSSENIFQIVSGRIERVTPRIAPR